MVIFPKQKDYPDIKNRVKLYNLFTVIVSAILLSITIMHIIFIENGKHGFIYSFSLSNDVNEHIKLEEGLYYIETGAFDISEHDKYFNQVLKLYDNIELENINAKVNFEVITLHNTRASDTEKIQLYEFRINEENTYRMKVKDHKPLDLKINIFRKSENKIFYWTYTNMTLIIFLPLGLWLGIGNLIPIWQKEAFNKKVREKEMKKKNKKHSRK